MTNDNSIKRWTAKCKSSVVIDIFKGKTTVAEVARQYDLTVSEIEKLDDEAQRSMAYGFRAHPKDIREQCESELCETKEALGEAHLQICALKARGRREFIRSLQAEIAQQGHVVSLVKLCQWLGLPRWTLYCRPRRRTAQY